MRENLIEAVRDAGRIDIFVYNAGLLVFGDPLTLDADKFDRMIDVTMRGAYFGSVEASRLMRAAGAFSSSDPTPPTACRSPDLPPMC